jgi:hypothetical protein
VDFVARDPAGRPQVRHLRAEAGTGATRNRIIG